MFFSLSARDKYQENAEEQQLAESVETLMTDSTLSDSVYQEDRPEEEYTEVVVTPKQSTLHIPITINVSLIEKKLNEKFSDLIYEDDNIEDDSLMLKAWKVSDFKISYDDNKLQYTIPIKIWIKKRFSLGFTYTDQEIEGAINLKLQTSINFLKDWNLATRTDFLEYSWISKPVLKLGIIDIPITPVVDKILKDNKTTMSKAVDETVRKYVPLSQYIKEIWSMVQDPIGVSASGLNAWVKITPKSLYTTPITGLYGQIKTTVGIKCLAEIYMDKQPATATKELDMPQFKMYSVTDEQANLNLLTDIPYTTIDSIAKDILQGDTLGEGRHSITVDSLEFYGQNDRMVIGVTVKGFVNGTIYLSGVPYYDNEIYSIKVRDVDYKLKTKNVLAKVVNLFYKNKLKSMIEEKVEIPLKDKLDMVKEMSRSELFNKAIVDNVYLNGYLDKINVDGIHITPKGLKVGIHLSGKFGLKVE